MKQTTHIRAVMLDWAGTTVDHGSIAPILALQTLFAKHAIALSMEDARRDMGLLKRDHIQAILALPNISSEWHRHFGKNTLSEPGAVSTIDEQRVAEELYRGLSPGFDRSRSHRIAIEGQAHHRRA